jgi:hypothetical protein
MIRLSLTRAVFRCVGSSGSSALHSSSERSNRMTTSEEERIILPRAGSRVYEGTDPSSVAFVTICIGLLRTSPGHVVLAVIC